MSSKNRLRAQQKKFWSPLRIVSTIIVLGLFATFGISSCNSRDEKTVGPTGVANISVKTAPPVGTNPAAPAALASLPANVLDAELRAASGSPIKLSDYSGKVILVNLWATWCGPCRIETPELVKLHKEFHSRGVEMIGLSTENPDASAESVRNFVRTFNVDYRIGWATADVAITLMQGREAIPQSFIIARDGRIMKRFVGFRPGDTPDDTPQQIRQALEEALKG
jgi:peroxiredoxin